MAHAQMLADQGIIAVAEKELIIKGLQKIRQEIAGGTFRYNLDYEDIHMNIEKSLIDKIGPAGGKLHTGRSRNDQVALDMHLYMLNEAKAIMRDLKNLQKTILKLAEDCDDLIIPGYTHLQRAQPVLFSHHLLAYFWMLERDRERLKGVIDRADLMPLGAGALAGSGFAVNREQVARALGFQALYENSMDAVSDRDYILEFLSFAAILVMHLSRLSEELVLWSTAEFNFIELDDAYTTGSSMMPQKKNPDVAELVRAKSGRVYGNLMAMLIVMKGLPLAYNKDMQEDKEGFFDTVDLIRAILPLFAAMLATMKINHKSMEAACDDDCLCATDLADYLVRHNIPFREAHHLVGQMILFSQESGTRLKKMSPAERGKFHPLLAEDVADLLDPVKVAATRKCRGGTAPAAVKEQLNLAGKLLEEA